MIKQPFLALAVALSAFVSSCHNVQNGSAPPEANKPNPACLAFSEDTLKVDVLKQWEKTDTGPTDGIVFQLINAKDGQPGGNAHRHLYNLIAIRVVGNKYQDGSAAIKAYGRPVSMSIKGNATDAKLGNYVFDYKQEIFPDSAAYLVLEPCLGDTVHLTGTHPDFTHYILYKKTYYDANRNKIPPPPPPVQYIYFINPSPPA